MSLTDTLSFTLQILVAGGKNLIAINLTWQIESGARETTGRAEGSDAGLGSRARMRIQPDLEFQPHLESPLTWGSIAPGAGGLHLPLQLWVKTPQVSIKQAHFFQSLLNSSYQQSINILIAFANESGPALHAVLQCCQCLLLPCCCTQSGTLAISHWKGGILVAKVRLGKQHCYHVHQAGLRGKEKSSQRGKCNITQYEKNSEISSSIDVAVQITFKCWYERKKIFFHIYMHRKNKNNISPYHKVNRTQHRFFFFSLRKDLFYTYTFIEKMMEGHTI